MKIYFSPDKIQHEGLKKINNNLFIYFRGYVIWNGHLYWGDEFIPELVQHHQDKRLLEIIAAYNGAFNIIIIDHKSLYVLNDRWGVFPLYYYASEKLVSISNDWKKLIRYTGKNLREDACIEMLTFGYVLGNKTLIENIDEFAPHSYYHIKSNVSGIDIAKKSYWEFKYQYQSIPEKKAEQDFAALWNHQIEIYTQKVKSLCNSAYIPMSGGLDSRLLAYYFDRSGINIHTMTFGKDNASPEIITARAIVNQLQHIMNHTIIYFDNPFLNLLAHLSYQDYDLITCAHFHKHLLFLPELCFPTRSFYIPGHDANYMAGENLNYGMQAWKSNDDIIRYVIAHKSSHLTAPLLKKYPSYRDIIYHSLEQVIPSDEPDIISRFNRWNGEQRQRRFIIRSSIPTKEATPDLFMPFFDYRIMDFFIQLPLKYLLNERVYVNTQLHHLYCDNPTLRKIKRDSTQRITPIRNNFIHEYYPKVKRKIMERLGLKHRYRGTWSNRDWSDSVDWQTYLHNLDLPAHIKLDWPGDYLFPRNIRYLATISEVRQTLNNL